MPKRLSQQEIERYQREGFLSPVRVLSLERAGQCLYARGLARPGGKHIPGQPSVVPQNMPGAGSLNPANDRYHADVVNIAAAAIEGAR